MAQELVTILWDDFNRSVNADETIRFSFDGVDYVIDLTEKNAEKFRKVMAPYVEHGRKEGAVSKPPTKAKSKPRDPVSKRQGAGPPGETKEDRMAIRRWARANGFDISDIGQISQDVRDAYGQWQPEPRASRPSAVKAVDALIGASK